MKIARISPRVTSSTLMFGAAALLLASTACEKEPTAPTKVAAANMVVPATASSATALAGETFRFPGGGSILDPALTNQNFTLTFGGTSASPTSTMVITTAAGAATGTVVSNVTFGSCTFTVTSSTTGFLQVGRSIRIDPCTITAKTSGLAAIGQTSNANVTLLLGSSFSVEVSLPLTVSPTGVVTFKGNTLGTVTVTNATGT